MNERKLTVGEKLKELRIAKGKSRSEVAKAVGVSSSAIAMYERDERIPRDDVKRKIAGFYKKNVSTIFFAS